LLWSDFAQTALFVVIVACGAVLLRIGINEAVYQYQVRRYAHLKRQLDDIIENVARERERQRT
jgi:uncharacterized membrane protein HdeD (DUF308 family)